MGYIQGKIMEGHNFRVKLLSSDDDESGAEASTSEGKQKVVVKKGKQSKDNEMYNIKTIFLQQKLLL